MPIRTCLLITLATLLPATAAAPQASESESVVRAATQFVRDSLPKAPIVIDTELLRAQAALGQSLARQIGATLGSFSDTVKCSVAQVGQRQMCSIARNATLLAFSQPRIENGSAEVTIAWFWLEGPGPVAQRSMTLALSRRATGSWHVTRVLAIGMS